MELVLAGLAWLLASVAFAAAWVRFRRAARHEQRVRRFHEDGIG